MRQEMRFNMVKFQAPGIQKDTDKTQRQRQCKNTQWYIYASSNHLHMATHKQKRTDLQAQTRILILLHKNWVASKIWSFESIKNKANSKKGVESRADEQGLPPTPWMGSLMSSAHCRLRDHRFFWLPWTRARGWCFPCRHQMTLGSTGWRTNKGGLTYMDRGCHMRTGKRIRQHTMKQQFCRWKHFGDEKVQRRMDWSEGKRNSSTLKTQREEKQLKTHSWNFGEHASLSKPEEGGLLLLVQRYAFLNAFLLNRDAKGVF